MRVSKAWRERLASRLEILLAAVDASSKIRDGGIVNATNNVSLVFGPGFVREGQSEDPAASSVGDDAEVQQQLKPG